MCPLYFFKTTDVILIFTISNNLFVPLACNYFLDFTFFGLCRQRRDVDLRDLLAVSVEAAVLGGKEVLFLN